MIRGNHKSSHSEMNSCTGKSISKEFDHGWALTPTTESLKDIQNAEVVTLGVVEILSINQKG